MRFPFAHERIAGVEAKPNRTAGSIVWIGMAQQSARRGVPVRLVVAVAIGFLLGVGLAYRTAAAASLTPLATLSPSNNADPWFPTTLTVARGTILIGGGVSSTEPVYLFTRTLARWSDDHEAAKLVASDAPGADFGTNLAINGSIVVIGGLKYGGSLYVYTEPPTGWAGTLSESARLVASDGTPIREVGMQGRSVIASATGACAARGGVFVFNQPATGWTGTIHESANLVASDGVRLTAELVSGGTVVANASERRGGLYIFQQPANGWKGTVHETARLRAPRGFQIIGARADGQTLFVDLFRTAGHDAIAVVTRPRRGWFGALRPSAMLVPPPVHTGAFRASAVSPGVAVGTGNAADGYPELYVFRKPAHAWRGTIRPSATLRPIYTHYNPSDLRGVAIVGRTIVADGVTAIEPHGDCPCGNQPFVFEEPRGGWSGTIRARSDRAFPAYTPGFLSAGAIGVLTGNSAATVVSIPTR
jgi:hypothetical protein